MNTSRREFMGMLALSAMAGGAPAASAGWQRRSSGKEALILDTARNAIFINLLGAVSHVDSFDFKEGPWHPEDNNWAPRSLPNGAAWPGLLFRLHELSDHFSLVRSLHTEEVNHQRAQFRLETAHPFIAARALQADIAPLGTILAYELREQANAGDIYPPFLTIGSRAKNSAIFGDQYSGFYLANIGLETLTHPDGQRAFDKRYDALWNMDPLKRRAAAGEQTSVSFLWDQAHRLMGDERVISAFDLEDETLLRYGYLFGRPLARAYRILSQDAGARFINIGLSDWDHHGNIYAYRHLPYQLNSLDMALAALLEDLEATPGRAAGKSLLDETMVVVCGEFGRTPGDLNATKGRDHYGDAYACLVAGGGIQGGRVIGQTDAIGAEIVDVGWARGRPISSTDLSATVLSALGIDYGTVVLDTPSGRSYRYTAPETWMATRPEPIRELF